MKPYVDGIQESGAVFADDSLLDWDGGIHWDRRPTGRGVVAITLSIDPGTAIDDQASCSKPPAGAAASSEPPARLGLRWAC